MGYMEVYYPRQGGMDSYRNILCSGYLADRVDDKLSLLVWSGLVGHWEYDSSFTASGGYRQKKATPQHYWEVAFTRSYEAQMGRNGLRIAPERDMDAWDWTIEPLVSYQVLVGTAAATIGPFDGCTLDTNGYHKRKTLSLVSCDKSALVSAMKELSNEKIMVGEIIQTETNWKKALGISHRFKGKTKGQQVDEIYLAGDDDEAAKKQLVSKLLLQQIPVLPEWEDALWNELQNQQLVTKLYGVGFNGFKIAIPREKILTDIFGEILIKGRKAPKPNALPAGIW